MPCKNNSCEIVRVKYPQIVYARNHLVETETIKKPGTTTCSNLPKEKAFSNPLSLLHKANQIRSFYKKKVSTDTTLIFESRFESGNLEYAIKVSDYEYTLILQYDTNSLIGHTQWFYFKVSNTTPGQVIQFNIVNLVYLMSILT